MSIYTKRKIFSSIMFLLFGVMLSNSFFYANVCIAEANSQPNSNAFSETRIIVTDCSVEEGGLESGTIRKITLTLKNTNSQWPVMGVLVTGSWGTDSQYSPVDFYVTNQAFAGDIQPDSEAEAVFYAETKDMNLSNFDNISCSLSISYTTDGQNEYVNNLVVKIPVNQVKKEALTGEKIHLINQNADGNDISLKTYAFLLCGGVCFAGGVVILIYKKHKQSR